MSESAAAPAPEFESGRPTPPSDASTKRVDDEAFLLDSLRSGPNKAFDHGWMLVSAALEEVLGEMRGIHALHLKDTTLVDEITAAEAASQRGRFAHLLDRPAFLRLQWEHGGTSMALERYRGLGSELPGSLQAESKRQIELRMNGALMARRIAQNPRATEEELLGGVASPLAQAPSWKPATAMLLAVAFHGEVERLDKMLALIQGFAGAAHETLQRTRLEHHHRLAALGQTNPAMSTLITRELIERLTSR